MDIPAGIEGDMNYAAWDDFCQHFECTLLGKTRNGEWWISTDNPKNFFWLGMNLALSAAGNPCCQTVREQMVAKHRNTRISNKDMVGLNLSSLPDNDF